MIVLQYDRNRSNVWSAVYNAPMVTKTQSGCVNWREDFSISGDVLNDAEGTWHLQLDKSIHASDAINFVLISVTVQKLQQRKYTGRLNPALLVYFVQLQVPVRGLTILAFKFAQAVSI